MADEVKTIAHELAKKQQEIGVAEFFARNRHLLGFDNKRKALLTTVKEAVDNSVEYNEPVLVREEGVIKLVKIGEYIDNIMKIASHIDRKNDSDSCNINEVEALSYNDETFKIEFKPISSVHRHPLHDKLYKLTAQGNRTVTVTGSHSVFVLKDGKVQPYKVEEIREGDYLVVPRRSFSTANEGFIDLRPRLIGLGKNRKLMIKNISHKFKELPRDWKRFDYIPLEYFIQNSKEIPIESWISVKGGRTNIPVAFNITPEFMRLLGYYTAEGTCYNSYITLSFGIHEEDLIKDAEYCIRKTFPKVKVSRVMAHATAITLKINSEIIAILFRDYLQVGCKANSKKVPGIIFNVSGDLQKHYLCSYIAGDGCVRDKITMATISKELSIGLKYLFSILGLPFSESVKKSCLKKFGKYTSHCKQVFYLYVYNNRHQNSPLNWIPITHSGLKKIIHELNPKIGSFNPHYRLINDRESFTFASAAGDLRLAQIQKRVVVDTVLETEIAYLQDLLMGDIGFLKIKKIEISKSSSPYVYDFSVPGSEKFLGGEGIIFLHNSLDACEEADILPEVIVDIVELSEERFRVTIEDNGPGIVKEQIPKIFAKLLYGSKFFKLSQNRGQQGIGISAAVMYGQITTGKPAKIISKIHPSKPAHYYELFLDTQKNKPEIVKEEETEWKKDHGTKVEIEIEASYQQGTQSIDEYLKQTAIVNPHVTIIYTNPKAEQFIYARAAEKNPKKPIEIKPHPYGVELGILQNMIKQTDNRTLQAFLTQEFSRVGPGTAKEICQNAALLPNTKPKDMTREMIEKLVEGIRKTKIISPPADCISPIGEELLEKGLRKEINAEYYCATTRPPAVYRGNPFIIESAVAYGGQQPAEEPARLLRYANRVPLLYQQGACAMTKSVLSTAWRNYGLNQSKGAMPVGPLTIVVSINSVWVPFTSESKEAIAHYPEIIKEVKLALQEIGRKLQIHVHKKRQVQHQLERANLFEKYIPEVADSLSRLTGENKEKILKKLQEMIKKEDIQKEIMEMEELKGEVEEDTRLAERKEEED